MKQKKTWQNNAYQLANEWVCDHEVSERKYECDELVVYSRLLMYQLTRSEKKWAIYTHPFVMETKGHDMSFYHNGRQMIKNEW